MPRFAGVITPVITPLNPDLTVDFDGLRSVLDLQISAGVDGIFVLGSSGEAIYLDDRDRDAVLRAAVKHVAGRVPVLVGALAPSPRRVIEQIRWIENYPVDAVVVTAPFYANVSDDEVVRHFEIVSDATGLPVLAYNIPGNVGRAISVEAFSALLRKKTICGLKDSSGAIDGFGRLLASTSEWPTASLMSGADRLADDALRLGADGLVPGLANVRPDLFVEIMAAHRSGDHEQAARVQTRINRLTAILPIASRHGRACHAGELGAMKQALVESGVIMSGQLCEPLTSYPSGALDELRAVLAGV